MANRYKKQNYDRGNEGRNNIGNRWSQSGRGGYGSDFDYEREDESYFGGRRYGEGNRSSDSVTNYNYDDDDDYTTSSYRGGRSRESGRENYGDSLNEYGGGGTYGGYRDRNYRNRSGNRDFERENDRSWLDRAGDEIASWFGDDDAERRRQKDIRGGHRGKGPKNYMRSDDRIRDDINDRLTDHDYLDASGIEVQVSSGEVTLIGTVDSRYAKRLAEDITDEVSGVKNVENRLRVSQSAYGQGSSSSFSNTTQNSATSSGMGMPDRVSGSTGMTETDSTETTTGESRGKTA